MNSMRYSIILFVLCSGLAMALGGYVWPGVALAVVGIIAFASVDADDLSEAYDDQDAPPFYDDERGSPEELAALIEWAERQRPVYED